MADTSIFPALMQNAALLLAMAFVYDVLTSRHRLGPWPLPVQLAVGLVLGGLGIVVMLSPWTYMPGIVFDTRSVLLGISGLFFGAIPTMAAMAMTALFRLSQGGAAALTGTAVILATGSIGLLWRQHRRGRMEELSWSELYLFGLLIHVAMLLLMLTLPWPTARNVLAHITLPVLVIYPAATTLLGLLMVNRLRREGITHQLQKSEERMRLFFERQIVGMAITSPQKGWLQVNDEICRMLGYSPEELSRLTWAEITHPDDLKADLDQFERLLAGAIDDYSMEKRFIRKDGATVWTELSVGCVRRADGAVDYVLALLADTTKRRQAEKALWQSEQRFRSLLEEVPNIAVQGYDRERRIVFWNAASEHLYGFSKEEALGRQLEDLIIPPAMREGVVAAVTDWMDNGVPIPAGELVLQGKGGRAVPVFSSHAMQRDNAGEPVMYCIDIDLAERNRAAEALRKSEERLRLALTAASQGLYDLNVQTGETEVSPEYATMLGYDPAEFHETNARWIERLHPDDHEPVAATYRDYIAGKIPRYRVEFRQRTKSGEWKWILSLGKVVEYDDAGRPLRMVGTHTDITERKQAEESLRQSEIFIHTVLDNLPIGIAVNSLLPEVEFSYMNDHFPRLYRTTREALAAPGAFWDAVYEEPEFRKRLRRRILDDCASGDPARMHWEDVPITRKGQETTYITARNTPIPGQKLMISTVWDVTERKRAEEEKGRLQAQLLQAQKMESVGRLAGGVAHDFNNMLQTILGYCDLTLNDLPPEDPLQKNLLEIRKAAQRSADLTRQLLAFARKQTAAPRVLDLNDTVAGMLKMLQRLIGENIDLIWIPGHELWRVRIDPSQFDQILANLVVNARDAIAGNGKVAIETENVRLDGNDCASLPECLPGEYALLTVSDNGCGMDRETLAHIFEPFFTTKEQGKGTGLGLATVYGIVRQNSGLLTVESSPGQGTTFRIYLPRVTDEPDNIRLGGVVAEPPEGGSETVLLVEDEEAILRLGKAILELGGYTVLATRSTAEALQLAREHPGPLHLLITDVVMPEMNGHALAEQINGCRPGIACLYMSGYTADIIARHGVLEQGVHFIQKPFTVQEFATAVRQALQNQGKGE
ncbi:MAG: PAS domain S-box protein [Thermodesulfobacteriota bacterium]